MRHAWRRRHLLLLLHCLGTRTNVRTHTLYNINSLLYKKEYERNLGTENCPNGSRYRIVTINISPKELLPFNCILFLLLRSTRSRARGIARFPTRADASVPSRMIWNDLDASRAAHSRLQLVSQLGIAQNTRFIFN